MAKEYLNDEEPDWIYETPYENRELTDDLAAEIEDAKQREWEESGKQEWRDERKANNKDDDDEE